MTPQEVARFRAETRGTRHVLHFNNAGSSLTPDAVHDAVVGHLEREREIGGYEAKAEASAAIDSFYAEAAALIGAAPDEIAYVENATRAWDMAFYSLPLSEGDRHPDGRRRVLQQLSCLPADREAQGRRSCGSFRMTLPARPMLPRSAA